MRTATYHPEEAGMAPRDILLPRKVFLQMINYSSGASALPPKRDRILHHEYSSAVYIGGEAEEAIGL